MEDENTIITFGRLSTHEFALEIMMAQMMAGATKEHSDAFLNDMVRLSRQFWAAGEVDDDSQEAATSVMMVATESMKNLVEKVRARTDEIRESINQ